jgi:hypothetical protein
MPGLAECFVEKRKKWADYLKTMPNQMVASRKRSIVGDQFRRSAA